MERKTIIKRALALAKNRICMGKYALTEQETMMTNGSWEAGFVEAVLLFLNEQNEHLLKEVQAEEYYQKLREGNKKAIETLYSRLHETQVQSISSSQQ